MKTFSLVWITTLMVLWAGMISGSVLGIHLVQAQAVPSYPDAPNYQFMPYIAKDAQTPMKFKSDIHVGNRGTDWNSGFLQRLRGTETGQWPAATVVLSDQVYTLNRTMTSPCRVNDADVRADNLYEYLSDAIEIGVIIIIRITPSPGNFTDYANPGSSHTLRTDETPAGGDYCGADRSQKSQQYRDILDIAQEMDAIYRLNVNEHGWPKERLFFEPANEPNNEWYWEKRPVTPNADNKQAWIDMDNYFAALYDRAKQLNANLQILAPSISQKLFGEHYDLGTCDNAGMVVVGGNGRTGLDFMKKTFGYDPAVDSYTTPKADGFAWHNYWREGQETWEPVPGIAPSLDVICPSNDTYRPRSDHLYQYYSVGMQVSIGSKPTFITEADLQSPCQNAANAIESKEQLPDGGNFAYRTRDSLINFTSQEFGARYVITWLLINQYDAPTTSCIDDNPNDEINWHEAYLENGEERLWFTLWWNNAQ